MPQGGKYSMSYGDGVKPFLAATRDRHNNRDIKDLRDMLEQGLNTANIGKAFNLTWQSSAKLIKAYKKELEAKKEI